MALTKQEWIRLEEKADELRKLCLYTTHCSSGHIGGSMSAADVLTALYYKYMNFDPKNPDDPNRDRCIVSKGHIGIFLAGMFADLGLVDKEELKTFNLTGSRLGMHLDSNKVKGLDASTGSLGHGPSLALGMAYGGRLNKKDYMTYVMTGDGELDEGSCWEAFMAISHFKLTNCVVIIDRNHFSIDGNTEDVMALEPLADKMTAFGFDTKVINGHRFDEICDAIEYAKKAPNGKPVCIISDSIKGVGMKLTSGNFKWHYGAINDEMYETCLHDLDEYKKSRIAVAEKEGI